MDFRTRRSGGMKTRSSMIRIKVARLTDRSDLTSPDLLFSARPF